MQISKILPVLFVALTWEQAPGLPIDLLGLLDIAGAMRLFSHEKAYELGYAGIPPVLVKQARADIERLTGIKKGLTLIRNFLHQPLMLFLGVLQNLGPTIGGS